jgi:hypothetical protein
MRQPRRACGDCADALARWRGGTLAYYLSVKHRGASGVVAPDHWRPENEVSSVSRVALCWPARRCDTRRAGARLVHRDRKQPLELAHPSQSHVLLPARLCPRETECCSAIQLEAEVGSGVTPARLRASTTLPDAPALLRMFLRRRSGRTARFGLMGCNKGRFTGRKNASSRVNREGAPAHWICCDCEHCNGGRSPVRYLQQSVRFRGVLTARRSTFAYAIAPVVSAVSQRDPRPKCQMWHLRHISFAELQEQCGRGLL